MHFAFRWMNCILMREMSLACTVRLFDTLLTQHGAEAGGLASFHVYVCAAFLMRWERELQGMEFQELILFLQKPPTEAWTAREIEGLIAQAYVYQMSEAKGGGGGGGASSAGINGLQ